MEFGREGEGGREGGRKDVKEGEKKEMRERVRKRKRKTSKVPRRGSLVLQITQAVLTMSTSP